MGVVLGIKGKINKYHKKRAAEMMAAEYTMNKEPNDELNSQNEAKIKSFSSWINQVPSKKQIFKSFKKELNYRGPGRAKETDKIFESTGDNCGETL